MDDLVTISFKPIDGQLTSLVAKITNSKDEYYILPSTIIQTLLGGPAEMYDDGHKGRGLFAISTDHSSIKGRESQINVWKFSELARGEVVTPNPIVST